MVEVKERNQKQPREQQEDLEKENLEWSRRKNDTSRCASGVGHAELGRPLLITQRCGLAGP